MRQRITISMFSGPRNISTTMMRAFENRSDTVVFDEPFYACYLKESGAQHPMRDEIIAAQPTSREAVADALNTPLPQGAAIAFQKHIAFHFAGGVSLDWMEDARPLLLIRDPRAMVASYKNKYEDAAPIAESFVVQRRILDDCAARRAPCPIIDAADVLRDPEGMLRALCETFGIEFSPAMLSWPAGPRDSDGVWAPHWYDAVLSSTGFRPFEERPIELEPDLEAVAARCAPDYAFLHRERMRT